MSPDRSRREFLRGRSLIHSLREATRWSQPSGSGAEKDPSAEPAHEGDTPEGEYLLQVGRQAMACDFQVSFPAGEYADGTEWALAALDRVDQIEERLSVFRDTSEISRINRDAAFRPVPIDDELFALLQLARTLHEQTDGTLDITSGPFWKLWGFARRDARVPSDEEIARTRPFAGFHHVALDDAARTIQFDTPGVELNLGCLGKGFALDEAGRFLEEQGMGHFLIHAGASSVLARGRPSPASPNGWSVGVADPARRGRRLAEITLRDAAIGTSGAAHQFFRHGGRRYCHILDPRSGEPADAGVLSVTVIAATAMAADALSTAFFVLGPDGARRYREDHAPDVGSLFVMRSAKGGGCEIVVDGIDDDSISWNEGAWPLRA